MIVSCGQPCVEAEDSSSPSLTVARRWMARVYANVNAALGPAWYDYGRVLLWIHSLHCLGVLMIITENLRIEWNVPDRYEIVRRLGGGKYSEVRTRTLIIHDLCSWA